jgi:hypothetical protein
MEVWKRCDGTERSRCRKKDSRIVQIDGQHALMNAILLGGKSIKVGKGRKNIFVTIVRDNRANRELTMNRKP